MTHAIQHKSYNQWVQECIQESYTEGVAALMPEAADALSRQCTVATFDTSTLRSHLFSPIPSGQRPLFEPNKPLVKEYSQTVLPAFLRRLPQLVYLNACELTVSSKEQMELLPPTLESLTLYALAPDLLAPLQARCPRLRQLRLLQKDYTASNLDRASKKQAFAKQLGDGVTLYVDGQKWQKRKLKPDEQATDETAQLPAIRELYQKATPYLFEEALRADKARLRQPLERLIAQQTTLLSASAASLAKKMRVLATSRRIRAVWVALWILSIVPLGFFKGPLIVLLAGFAWAAVIFFITYNVYRSSLRFEEVQRETASQRNSHSILLQDRRRLEQLLLHNMERLDRAYQNRRLRQSSIVQEWLGECRAKGEISPGYWARFYRFGDNCCRLHLAGASERADPSNGFLAPQLESLLLAVSRLEELKAAFMRIDTARAIASLPPTLKRLCVDWLAPELLAELLQRCPLLEEVEIADPDYRRTAGEHADRFEAAVQDPNSPLRKISLHKTEWKRTA